MKYNIAVFSVELFTPTAKFIKRDFDGLDNVHFFAHKKSIPSVDFTNIEVISPKFNLLERGISFFFRKLDLRYYFMSCRMKKFYLKEFKRLNIDIVIAHFGPSGVDILNVCKELNIPLITVFHGYDISKLISKKSYLNGLRKLNEYKYSKVRAVANFFISDLMKYIDFKKIFLLENGVEVSNELPFNEITDEIYILQAANLVEKKGIEYSIKSVIKLIDNSPSKKIHFDICGDGPLRGKLESLVNEKYRKNIIFHGHLSGEKFQLLFKRSNIFIHPSITDSSGETETIPTSILEAMSLGKIVVSTFHAGIPEVVVNKNNGFLVSEKSIDQLFDILKNIINNVFNLDDIKLESHKTIFENFNSVRQYEKFKMEIKYLMDEKFELERN